MDKSYKVIRELIEQTGILFTCRKFNEFRNHFKTTVTKLKKS